MGDIIIFCLFGGAVLFAVLSGILKRWRPLWALSAAVCIVFGVLTGLTLGWTPDRLLPPLLVVCAAAMAALFLGKGGGER